MRLPPVVYKSLPWPEVDNLIHGYERGRQLDLVGPRRIARELSNQYAKEPQNDEQYWPLPLIDAPAEAVPAESQEAFLARLRARGLTPVP